MTEAQLQELKRKVDELYSIILGIGDDPRFKAKVRDASNGYTPANAKPYITLRNGDRYEITNVTKLN